MYGPVGTYDNANRCNDSDYDLTVMRMVAHGIVNDNDWLMKTSLVILLLNDLDFCMEAGGVVLLCPDLSNYLSIYLP